MDGNEEIRVAVVVRVGEGCRRAASCVAVTISTRRWGRSRKSPPTTRCRIGPERMSRVTSCTRPLRRQSQAAEALSACETFEALVGEPAGNERTDVEFVVNDHALSRSLRIAPCSGWKRSRSTPLDRTGVWPRRRWPATWARFPASRRVRRRARQRELRPLAQRRSPRAAVPPCC